jgi:hypothetical protein
MNRKGFSLTLITLLVLLLGVAVAVAVAQEPVPQGPESVRDALGTTASAPLNTGFTYQGQLQRDGSPVDGPCEMAFRLYDAAELGGQVGSPISRTVPISDGLFTVGLDFGPTVFAGDGRWLGIRVGCPGDGDYVDLGRQELTATPYALFARSAPWSGLAGLPDGFADGVDDVSAVISGTGIYAGDGLTQVSSGDSVTMAVYFAGSGGDHGSAVSVARSDHAHDDSYYTEAELQTGGSASVHWDNLTSVPSGLADGDDDTTYTAGAGLALDGTEFSVVTATIQQRVAGACGAGYAIRQVNADGTVTCEPVSGGAGGDFWSLTGNAGTDPSTNFVGTSDNVSLTLAVNGTAALRLEPSGGTPNLIGGYGGNTVTNGVQGAAIGGGGASGEVNRVTDKYGVVGGGYGNQAGNDAGTTSDAAYATVGGGWGNDATGYAATVAGGRYNEATADSAAIGGGQYNDAAALYATVGGGYSNIVTATYATIAGGRYNDATAEYVTVGGGYNNDASGDYATVGGGADNIVTATYATVGGGTSNQACAIFATISGGHNITVTGDAATVGGGDMNSATAAYATVGGGQYNDAAAMYGTVGGGYNNYVSGSTATIGGGHANYVNGHTATIGGGHANYAGREYATIGGGFYNSASGYAATIPGGQWAMASLYGQMAYASGSFSGYGDAQAGFYVLRNTTSDASQTELFLDGSSESLVLNSNRTLTFDILIVARSSGGESAGYQVRGIVENDDGSTSLIGSPVVTTLGEDRSAWNVAVEADDTNEALVIKVTGETGRTVRWVATVRTAEVMMY